MHTLENLNIITTALKEMIKELSIVSSTCVDGGGTDNQLQTKQVENAVVDHAYNSPDSL